MKTKAPARRGSRKAAAKAAKAVKPLRPRAARDFWQLRLYIAGKSPKSVTAFRNLERICREHLEGRYAIEVVDLVEHPKLAVEDQIIAVPTLVRRLPPPLRKIVGDLENEARTLVGLQLRAERAAGDR